MLSGEVLDYLIVGAGSTGSSIAFNMAGRSKRIGVIERNAVAGGNTGKSSALVRTHYSNRIIADMSLYSLNVFRNFSEIGYSGFTGTGMIFPFDHKYEDVARENVSMLREVGINEVEISPADIRQYYPDVNLDGYDYVTYEPESGYADPVATANSFMIKARERGVELIQKRSVVSVDQGSNYVRAELDDGREIRAKKVMLATNVWTNDILGNSGISKDRLLPIYASLHQIIYLRRPQEYSGIKPTLWDPHQLSYYKMEGTTVTALGSLDPKIDENPVNIHDNIPETADDSFVEDYISRLAWRLPSMGKATIISSLTGLYDMSPDGQVICDSLEDLGMENVFVFVGLSGHGFKLSPAYGLMAADMLTGKDPEKSRFDWRPFYLNRFRDGRQIRSKYAEIGTIY